MAGTYVALPDLPFILVLPPDWNPIWEFPGVLPPGFEIADGFYFSADSQIAVGQATSQIQAVTMDVRNGIIQPTGSLTFTATIDGVPINLKVV